MSKWRSSLDGLFVLAFVILGASAVYGGQGAGLADEAKRFQASERGFGQLVGVAELNTDVTRVSFETNSEVGLVTNYGSAVCPIPGSTRLTALRKAGRGSIEAEIRRLHPVADANGDGFVSDEEGKSFGTLVHFGQALNYFMTGPTRSSDEIARLMRLSPGEYQARLDAYRLFVIRALKLGVTFVSSPSVEMLAQNAPPN